MRTLSALVVMHCFGCVIPKDSDEDLMHQRPIRDHSTMAENSNNQIPSKGCPAVGNSADADADDRRERYNLKAVGNQTTDTDKQASSMDFRAADHKLSRNRHTSGLLHIQKAGFIHLIPERSASVASVDRRIPVRNQLLSWHHRRRGAPLQRTKWRTPLRSYSRHILVKRHVKPAHRTRHLNGDYRSYRKSTETERKNSEAGYGERVAHEEDSEGDDDHTAEAAEKAETEAGEWDEWAEWSECSTSCGCGRQVRWRHCGGKGCMNGLKKAQIRTCHLRDCNNKNFLSWLGVKA